MATEGVWPGYVSLRCYARSLIPDPLRHYGVTALRRFSNFFTLLRRFLARVKRRYAITPLLEWCVGYAVTLLRRF
jgi:hypothetical protein